MWKLEVTVEGVRVGEPLFFSSMDAELWTKVVGYRQGVADAKGIAVEGVKLEIDGRDDRCSHPSF